MIEAYPLHYPINHQRTPAGERKDAQFKTSFARARDTTLYNLRLLRAEEVIISSNIPLRRDGLPYAAGEKNLQDPGIAVYFFLNGEQKVICCDAFLSIADNMQAVAKSLEALRGLQRWRCSNILTQALAGFKALPDANTFWKTFDLDHKPETIEELKKAYRVKVALVHPDIPGGNRDQYELLNAAYQTALKTFE